MRMTAPHWLRQLTLLIAMLVALMPTVSRLSLAPAQGTWQPVCSAMGTRWVQVNTAQTDVSAERSVIPRSSPDGEGPMLDCPLCVLGLRALPLPLADIKVESIRWLVRYVVPAASANLRGLSPGGLYVQTPPLRGPPIAAFDL